MGRFVRLALVGLPATLSAACTFGGSVPFDTSDVAIGTSTGSAQTSMPADPDGDGAAEGPDPAPDSSGDGGGDAEGTAGLDGGSTDGGTDDGSSESGEPACTNRAWWDTAWSHRRALSINNADVGEDLSEFPVLVRLTATRIDYMVANPDGDDIRFVAADGVTVLPHEIETWNPAGDSFVWVRLDLVPEQGTDPEGFHLYFGNRAAASGEDPPAVWANGYLSVHHMGSMTDSTGNGHDGVSVGAPVAAPGLVGEATVFDGVDDHIVVPEEEDFDFGSAIAVEVLSRVSNFDAEWQAIITKGDSAWRMHRYRQQGLVAFSSTAGGFPNNMESDSAIDDGQWHSVAMSLTDDRKRIFVDGVKEDDDLFLLNINENDAVVMIGANADVGGRNFDGLIDEVRISGVKRSQAWLSVSHRASVDAGFVVYGDLEACADEK